LQAYIQQKSAATSTANKCNSERKRSKIIYIIYTYIIQKTTLIDTTITEFAKEEANAPTETKLGLDD
jgi:uncharacterized membrane protein